MPTDDLLVLVIFLVILFGIFLIGRESTCWYFKINERLKNQQRIIQLLESQVQTTTGQVLPLPSDVPENSPGRPRRTLWDL